MVTMRCSISLRVILSLSRAGPRAVPHTAEVACRSCCLIDVRNASTAARAEAAPVCPPDEGDGLSPPELAPLFGHAASTSVATQATPRNERFTERFTRTLRVRVVA